MRLLQVLWFWFFIVFITLLCIFLIQLSRFNSWIRGKPTDQELGHRIGEFWGISLFRFTPGWSIEIYGRQNIPQKGAFVIAANHESAADIFALYVLGISFRWLGKASVFRIPGVGAAMRHNGYIPITRGDKASHHQALEASSAHLKAGTSMLFFPEGTRSTTGSPGPFKVGAFKLAKENQVPVLPVVLQGAAKLLKKKSLFPNRARLLIQVLPPMTSPESESIEAFTHRVRDQMVEAHSHLVGLQTK